jgi:hypothetical protein
MTAVRQHASSFGGLVVSMLSLVPKIARSNPAEAVGSFGHAFFRRGSKAVCPMSQLLKNPAITWKSDCLAKFDR